MGRKKRNVEPQNFSKCYFWFHVAQLLFHSHIGIWTYSHWSHMKKCPRRMISPHSSSLDNKNLNKYQVFHRQNWLWEEAKQAAPAEKDFCSASALQAGHRRRHFSDWLCCRHQINIFMTQYEDKIIYLISFNWGQKNAFACFAEVIEPTSLTGVGVKEAALCSAVWRTAKEVPRTRPGGRKLCFVCPTCMQHIWITLFLHLRLSFIPTQLAVSRPIYIHFRHEKNNQCIVHSSGSNPKKKTWDDWHLC